MSHPEVPDEAVPPDTERILMPNSVREQLLASLQRVDEAIAGAMAPAPGTPTATDLELMLTIGNWTEHSRRVRNVLHHVVTDEDRIAHLDFSADSAEG